jgi:hypothetical protein
VIHRLQLALRIYQLEHGRYPENLTELPEDDQKGIPEDVLLGASGLDTPIAYLPEGIDRPLSFDTVISPRREWALPAGSPLLRQSIARPGGLSAWSRAVVADHDRRVLYYPVP